jgi:hypothetical protein
MGFASLNPSYTLPVRLLDLPQIIAEGKRGGRYPRRGLTLVIDGDDAPGAGAGVAHDLVSADAIPTISPSP